MGLRVLIYRLDSLICLLDFLSLPAWAWMISGLPGSDGMLLELDGSAACLPAWVGAGLLCLGFWNMDSLYAWIRFYIWVLRFLN